MPHENTPGRPSSKLTYHVNDIIPWLIQFVQIISAIWMPIQMFRSLIAIHMHILQGIATNRPVMKLNPTSLIQPPLNMAKFS